MNDLFSDGYLRDIRAEWRGTIEGDGGHCPCCDRWGKIYARPINRTMARSLIWLHQARRNEDGWVDVPATAPRWVVRSNQLPTLRWWNLVERRTAEDDSLNKHSGMWRATELGSQFAIGKIDIPERVFTYNGEVEARSDKTVNIAACFTDLFDYEQTMRENFNP